VHCQIIISHILWVFLNIKVGNIIIFQNHGLGHLKQLSILDLIEQKIHSHNKVEKTYFMDKLTMISTCEYG